MVGKRKRQQRKKFRTAFALNKAKTEQMKGRDRTMLQKRSEYWQEVNSE